VYVLPEGRQGREGIGIGLRLLSRRSSVSGKRATSVTHHRLATRPPVTDNREPWAPVVSYRLSTTPPLHSSAMQGVVKVFDASTGFGIVVSDADRREVFLDAESLEGSIFRTLRQGQRIVFDVEGDGEPVARRLRMGSEGT
jgi:cold shock CspA family protein